MIWLFDEEEEEEVPDVLEFGIRKVNPDARRAEAFRIPPCPG